MYTEFWTLDLTSADFRILSPARVFMSLPFFFRRPNSAEYTFRIIFFSTGSVPLHELLCCSARPLFFARITYREFRPMSRTDRHHD